MLHVPLKVEEQPLWLKKDSNSICAFLEIFVFLTPCKCLNGKFPNGFQHKEAHILFGFLCLNQTFIH